MGKRGSITALAVNLAEHRFAALMPTDIVQQHAKGTFGLGHRRDMRRQQYLRMLPERVIRCCRLLLQDVEHRGTELAAGQGREQVLFYQVPTAAHVDQGRALGQVLEQLAVENPLGLFGQWQDADHDVALAEERWELFVTGKAFHPGDAVFAACPTGQDETKGLQGGQDLLGLHAKPHDTDPTLGRRLQQMRLPAPGDLLLAITEHIPVQAEHGETGVLAHAPGDTRIESVSYTHLTLPTKA